MDRVERFMKTEPNISQESQPAADRRKATGRLIATFGAARILRHRDGTLDVCSETPTERNATLAWLFTVSPELAVRVRRCSSGAV
jgi:hypothetical protein